LLELNNTGSTRPTVGLILNLSTCDLANCGEQLDKILVAGGPRQVANVDQVAGLAAGRSEVGEWVRGVRRTVGIKSAYSWATEAAAESSASAKATAETTTSAEAATATSTEASSKTTACSSEAAASTKASVASKTIFAHLKVAALPLVAVELSNGVPSIVYCLEGNDTRALWSAIWCDMDICAKD
jgi:hypothetical protein